MPEVSRIATVDKHRFEVAPMTPVVAGFVWNRLLNGVRKAVQDTKQQPKEVDEDKEQPPARERMRGMVTLAFMYLDFADYEFIQDHALQTVSWLEKLPTGQEVPTPIWNFGTLVVPFLVESPFLVTKIVTEALAINLSGFLG